ncbi:MAG TPA: hypothetical protein VFJ64_10625 [Solirubrobacterales bacterium]|nr:hypothetical protein [Solirubrobacterales bacterium]
MGARTKASIAVALGLLVALLIPAPASAAVGHIFKETFGSAAQPSFANPGSLAVDPSSSDLYAIEGRTEQQRIHFTATAGKFKVKFGAANVGEFAFNAPPKEVETALEKAICGGEDCLDVEAIQFGTFPNYVIRFNGPLTETDVPQITCENGTPPLSGGEKVPGWEPGVCNFETDTNGVTTHISRYHSDGTPANFSAPGSNGIYGGETPQGRLFNSPQIAVDDSGGTTDGDIYLVQRRQHLVDVFAPSGAYLGQLTASSEGALGEVTGVAVDPSGAVYVADAGKGKVHKYVPASNPVTNADNSANFTRTSASALAAGAGPSAGFIFSDSSNKEPVKLDSTTGEQRYVVDPGASNDLAVNQANGHLISASASESAVKEYDASGATEAKLLDSFSPGGGGSSIAVDSSTGDIYVARQANPKIEVWATVNLPEAITKAATGITTGSATLNGTVNPEGVPLKPNPAEGCFFEWGATASYGHTAPCEAPNSSEVGSGKAPVAVHAAVAGLKAGSTYHFRLIAANAAAPVKGKDEALVALGPSVGEEEAKEITTTSATIAGTVNPRGESTGFFVEYVTEAEFNKSGYNNATKAPASPVAIGSENAFLEVSQGLTELSPGTTYHYRLVATNPIATVPGADKTFSTFAAPPADLPDGRAWEMVSPPQKIGEAYAPEPGGFLGGSCEECLPGINDLMMPMQASPDGNGVAFEGQAFSGGFAAGVNEYLGHRGSLGWGTTDITGLNFFASVKADGFSAFKAFSADLAKGVLAQGEPALSEDAPLGPGGVPFANLYLWEEGVLMPLVTTEPPNRTPGAHNGAAAFIPVFAGANSDFTHVIFAANDALTGEVEGIAPPAPAVAPSRCELPGEKCNLYEWAEGELRLVNVLPGNGAAVAGVIGAGRQLTEHKATEAPDLDNAISADGSRIFWSDEAGQAYVRIDGEETREVKDPGAFLTASVDGSRVLLNDGCLYSLAAEACEAQIGGPSTFQGILGAADDLSHVYFTDKAALTGGEENANGEVAVAGAFNLYAWSEAGGTKFIGRLLSRDNSFGLNSRYGDWRATPQNRTAQASPDGRYLAFMSRAKLTGQNNEVAGEGCRGSESAVCLETFEYAAGSEELTCVSCNPTGLAPLGQANLSLFRNASTPFPQPHNLTDSGEGRIFFESQDTLSPKDTNGHIQDVYEWEPDGVGSCEKPGGCVFLISSGHSPNDSMFVDATPSGDDAFFVTREKLAPQDKDEMLDLYDARVGGGIEAVEEVPCEGEACKGPGTEAPSQPGAGSAEFVGPGNEKPRGCPPGKVRRRGKCTKKPNAHKHKHRRQAAKHSRGGAK